MSKYMIGIDIGTQSIRVHMYDENTRCVAKRSTLQYVKTPRPMWATQDASFWWDTVKKSIREILEETKVNREDIVSIGCCAIMHGPVPVRKDGSIVEKDVQIYCDKRAADIANYIKDLPNIEEIYHKTANMPTANWFGLKVKWLKDNEPEVYAESDAFLVPKDFINFKFTGRTCMDYSEASGSFLMDKDTQAWSDELIRLVGVDREKLPVIHSSTDVIGHVTEEVAAETGLSVNTAVICGAGDMLASLYTSGLCRKGNLVDCTGTGSIICYYDDEPIMDPRVMNLRHVLDGWVPFGNIDSSGGAFRWLRDNLAKDETKFAHQEGKDEYAYLCELAEKTPIGADGLLFFPYLMGERTMGTADSRGCFIGLNLGTKISHMVRAVLEGIAFEHKRTIDIFEKDGKKITEVYHTAGGAKGDFWNQIKADIYEKPVCTLDFDEGGVLGVAILGGVATGIFDDPVAAAEKVTKIKKRYLPNKENFPKYRELYKVFCSLHDTLQQPFAELARAAEK